MPVWRHRRESPLFAVRSGAECHYDFQLVGLPVGRPVIELIQGVGLLNKGKRKAAVKGSCMAQGSTLLHQRSEAVCSYEDYPNILCVLAIRSARSAWKRVAGKS